MKAKIDLMLRVKLRKMRNYVDGHKPDGSSKDDNTHPHPPPNPPPVPPSFFSKMHGGAKNLKKPLQKIVEIEDSRSSVSSPTKSNNPKDDS